MQLAGRLFYITAQNELMSQSASGNAAGLTSSFSSNSDCESVSLLSTQLSQYRESAMRSQHFLVC